MSLARHTVFMIGLGNSLGSEQIIFPVQVTPKLTDDPASQNHERGGVAGKLV